MKRPKDEKRVITAVNKIFKRMGTVKTKHMLLDRGVNEDIINAIESLLDKRTQILCDDEYMITVVTFETGRRPRRSETLKELLFRLADYRDCPSTWVEDYYSLVEYED